MTIMADRGWDDARTTTRLLAGTAVECLRNPTVSVERETALDNVYRLLESFRTNPIFGFMSVEARGHNKSIDNLTISMPRERHLGQVRDALRDAFKAVFGGRSTDEAVKEIEAVLRSLLDPQSKTTPAARQRATRFFTELTQRLPST